MLYTESSSPKNPLTSHTLHAPPAHRSRRHFRTRPRPRIYTRHLTYMKPMGVLCNIELTSVRCNIELMIDHAPPNVEVESMRSNMEVVSMRPDVEQMSG